MGCVLVIDDEAAVREMLALILGEAGHRFEAAVNGRDGLKLFQAARPDVVVTDIIMPEKEGIETIRELRRLDPSVPIVAISGSGSVGGLDVLALAEKLGATQVLSKPFIRSALLLAVEKALGSSVLSRPSRTADPLGAVGGS